MVLNQIESPLLAVNFLRYFSYLHLIIILMTITAVVVVVAKSVYFQASQRWKKILKAVLFLITIADITVMVSTYLSIAG